MEVEYDCEAHGEQCHFTMAASVSELAGVFGKALVPVITWGMRREVRAHVGNLKNIFET